MNMKLITFRSITPAQRGQRVLQQGGIESALMRTPRRMEEKGCGYCLRIRSELLEKSLKLLDEAGVPYEKVLSFGEGVVP